MKNALIYIVIVLVIVAVALWAYFKFKAKTPPRTLGDNLLLAKANLELQKRSYEAYKKAFKTTKETPKIIEFDNFVSDLAWLQILTPDEKAIFEYNNNVQVFDPIKFGYNPDIFKQAEIFKKPASINQSELEQLKQETAYQNYKDSVDYQNELAKSKGLKIAYTYQPLEVFLLSEDYKNGKYDTPFVRPLDLKIATSTTNVEKLMNESKADVLLKEYKTLINTRPLFARSKVNFDSNSMRANEIEQMINKLGFTIVKSISFGGKNEYKLI